MHVSMTLSKILTVMIALPCMIAFGSLGGEFRKAIADVSGVEIGAVSAAASDSPTGAPDLVAQLQAGLQAGDADPSTAPSSGGAQLGSQGTDGQSAGGDPQSASGEGLDPNGLSGEGPDVTLGEGSPLLSSQPGTEAYSNDSGTKNIPEQIASRDLSKSFSWESLSGALAPIAGIVGGVVAKAVGVAMVKVASGALLTFTGTVIGGLGTAAAVIGGVALLGYVGYKVVEFAMDNMAEMNNADGAAQNGPPAGAVLNQPAELPTEEELAAELDADGEGISEEDLLDNEPLEPPSVDLPELDPVTPGSDLSDVEDLLNGGSDNDAEQPTLPTANTTAEKFAKAILDGANQDARDKFQALLTVADLKSDAEVETQAREILDYLSAHDYDRNEKVLQWTEEAIMMGYDPRLPLALAKISQNGNYSAKIYNDFGGAWNAIADDAEIYDIIDSLGACGKGPSCTSAMTNMAHSYVSGSGHRLSANPNASASEMTAELIEAIETYLAGDAVAMHTAETIRPLLESYPR